MPRQTKPNRKPNRKRAMRRMVQKDGTTKTMQLKTKPNGQRYYDW